jgi:hypothetical protein
MTLETGKLEESHAHHEIASFIKTSVSLRVRPLSVPL